MDSLGPEGESEDEWFYESITRYDDLLMYDVHGDICCSAFYDNAKVLLGVSRGSLHELLLLSLPDKLLAGRSAGLVRNRDFNLVAAAYTAGSIKQVVRVGSRVVVAGQGGIHLYSVPGPSSASDVISLSSTLRKAGDGEAVLAVSGDQVFAGHSLADLTQMDLSSEKTGWPSVFSNAKQRNADISEMMCVGDKLFICLRNEGCVLICDPRTASVLQEVQVQEGSSGLWAADASRDGELVALASSCGSVRVFDVRNTQQEMFSHTTEDMCDRARKVTVHFSPSDPLLSVSRFDRTVEILNYKCGQSESKIFRHDGHRGKDVHVVTHLWHPVKRNLLFSADDKGKLNAWRFKQPLKS